MLAPAGERPVFLTRGYGGRLAGPVRVDPARHRALDVGDEPLLLARVAPTIVARDRVAGARMAVAGGASVIVMDDGFQNPSLTKDLSLLVVDGRRGIGNGRVIPAGPLRAPLRAQLARAHAMVVVGMSAGGRRRGARTRALAICRSCAPACIRMPGLRATLAAGRVLAFAGIGDPQKFFATLARGRDRGRRNAELSRSSPLHAGRSAGAMRRSRPQGSRPGDDGERSGAIDRR